MRAAVQAVGKGRAVRLRERKLQAACARSEHEITEAIADRNRVAARRIG
jgi:hypothetical protein